MSAGGVEERGLVSTTDLGRSSRGGLGGWLSLLGCLGGGSLGGLRCLLSVLGLGGGCGLSLTAVGGGPQRQVVAEELHDQGAVTVGLLGERVELGDGIVEGLLGQVARAVGRVQDLVVEDREVKGETQADGVGGGELGLGNVGGVL